MGRWYYISADCADEGYGCSHKWAVAVQSSDAPQKWKREGGHEVVYRCPITNGFSDDEGDDWPEWSERADWDDEDKERMADHMECCEKNQRLCDPIDELIRYRFDRSELPWLRERLAEDRALFGPAALAYIDYCHERYWSECFLGVLAPEQDTTVEGQLREQFRKEGAALGTLDYEENIYDHETGVHIADILEKKGNVFIESECC